MYVVYKHMILFVLSLGFFFLQEIRRNGVRRQPENTTYSTRSCRENLLFPEAWSAGKDAVLPKPRC